MTRFTGKVKGELFPAYYLLHSGTQITQTIVSFHHKIKVFPFHNLVPPLKMLCASIMGYFKTCPTLFRHSCAVFICSDLQMHQSFFRHTCFHTFYLFLHFYFLLQILTVLLVFCEESTVGFSLLESSK